jgi:rhamnosyltransferase
MRATVVLPIKNGARFLPTLLEALRRQAFEGGLEVLAIDSGSLDASAALLDRAGARTLRIAAEAFDHGETRNLGVREARGRTVVFLTQDALPADEHLVRHLVEALEPNPRIAGAFARQIPRPDADVLTRRDLGGWVAAEPEARTVFVDRERFEALGAFERYRLCAFDNVASAARRDLLLAHPFVRARFGEDLQWGRQMLLDGLGLAYVPRAVVVHSHPRTARSLYRRNYLGHRLLFRLFGIRTIPGPAHVARAAAGTALRDLLDLARGRAAPAAYLAAPAQAWAAVYGQYAGARDERTGRPYPAWA